MAFFSVFVKTTNLNALVGESLIRIHFQKAVRIIALQSVWGDHSYFFAVLALLLGGSQLVELDLLDPIYRLKT